MHAALSSLTLRGLGHEVTLGYLPYGDYDEPVSRFDLRRQDLYAQQVLKEARAYLKVISLLKSNRYGQFRRNEPCSGAGHGYDTQYIRQGRM